MLNKKIFFIPVIIIVIFIIGIVVLFLSKNQGSIPSNNSSGLIISSNAIYVAEQVPGTSISVAVVRLEKPGFAVIHEDSNGVPDKILGASNLLQTGEAKNLPPIMLSRLTKDGETIFVMLHTDNGDGKFNAKEDKPALDSVGGEPVMMIVTISKDATEPGAINP